MIDKNTTDRFNDCQKLDCELYLENYRQNNFMETIEIVQRMEFAGSKKIKFTLF